MTKQKIIAFARSKGYDGAMYSGKWNGYEVYEPTVKGSTEEDPAIIGVPLIILVKGEDIRLSTVDEAFEYLDTIDESDE
jgi:hypothetical protein